MGKRPDDDTVPLVVVEPGPDWIEDAEGYERAYKALYPEVSALVGRLLAGSAGSQWVDKVVSDTFLAIGLKWPDYGQRPQAHLRNGVRRAAINKVKDLFKTSRLGYDHDHAVEPSEGDVDHQYTPGVPSESDTEEEALDRLFGIADPDEEYELLVQGLASEVALYGRSQYREILTGRFINAYDLEFIADRLGLGYGTVRNYSAEAMRLASAILALRTLASAGPERTGHVSLWTGLSFDRVVNAVARAGGDADLLRGRFVDGRRAWAMARERDQQGSKVHRAMKTSLLLAWQVVEDHAVTASAGQR